LIGTESHLTEKIDKYSDMGISVLTSASTTPQEPDRVRYSLTGLGKAGAQVRLDAGVM